MRHNGLCVLVGKTQTIMLTSKRGYRISKLRLKGTLMELSKHVRYLGVELSSNLGFKEHIRETSERANKTSAALARLLPNLGGPKLRENSWYQCSRVSFFVHLLYGMVLWSSKTILTSCLAHKRG